MVTGALAADRCVSAPVFYGRFTEMANPSPAQIAAAIADLSAREPAWAERYETAARLLANGGWQRRVQFVTFPGGVVTQPGACTCQEGRGPIVCIHRVALQVLEQAEIPACTDCGARLTNATIARIGHHLCTICRACHAARAAAGRRRQLAADRALVARC
jgi:hypothetical protein